MDSARILTDRYGLKYKKIYFADLTAQINGIERMKNIAISALK